MTSILALFTWASHRGWMPGFLGVLLTYLPENRRYVVLAFVCKICPLVSFVNLLKRNRTEQN